VVLDDAVSELESKWVDNNDHADVIAAAQDAAIVRQALAMLSPAERAALVMWEMEGRSTKEIAVELGIKESAVRHTVSRARASLRRVMSELIIDKERGLTALDILSTTYKKAVTAGKKSSKAALSLILVFFAFLGFNSMPTENELPINIVENSTSQNQSSSIPETTPVASSSPSVSASSSTGSSVVKKASAVAANAKATKLNFPGLDINGVPTNFTVTDATGALGSLYFSNRQPVFSETELSLSQLVKTQEGAANILISQQLTSGASGFTYQANLSYGRKGSWIPLNSRVSFMDMERLVSGNYLVTVVLKVESEVETSIQISASTNGRDLDQAPTQVISRLVLNPSKTEVLAQAVNVVEKRAK
jgi:DNA-binding CsgD family transcriptional regulator